MAKPDDPVAIIGSTYQLLWTGKGHMTPGLKVGDMLYTSPPQQKPLMPQDFWHAAPWQPMETAPKDESVLLKMSDKWNAVCYLDEDNEWKYSCNGENIFTVNPIAWLPLPENK